MKKIIYAIIFTICLCGCYKDKSSTKIDFDANNFITNITFEPRTFLENAKQTIEFTRPLGTDTVTQKITVNIEQTKQVPIEKLKFTWVVSQNNGGKKDVKVVKDTFYTKGFLDIRIPPGKDSQFNVFLEVKDTISKLARYASVIVKTREPFKNSWFILHGNEPGYMNLGNVEVIGDKATVCRNAYKKIHRDAEDNPFRFGKGLVYTTMYNNGFKNYLGVFNSDGTTSMYDAFSMNRRFDHTYMLPHTTNQKPFIYKSIVEVGQTGNETDYKCLISQDGRFYLAKSLLCFYDPGNTRNLDPSTYDVTAATITYTHFIMWDNLHKRFIYRPKEDNGFRMDEERARSSRLTANIVNTYVTDKDLPTTLKFDNKSAVYGYVNYKEGYEDSHAFFIFKEDGKNRYFRYELTPVKKGKTRGDKDDKKDGNDEIDNEPKFSIEGKYLRNFNPERASLIIYNTFFTSNFIFYATASTIYRYDVEAGNSQIIWRSPEGYSINIIKLRSFDIDAHAGDLGLYIGVGLNKAEEGAFAEIKLTTGADIDKKVPVQFYWQDDKGDKFGNIADIQFARIYKYFMKDYDKKGNDK